jgi:hypothetical protein
MKITNKVFLVGMISVVLAFGFVFASCSQVFEGTALLTNKTVKLTLTSNSYKIEYDGATYSGDATKFSAGRVDEYTFTSGGTGKAVVTDKKIATLAYTNGTVSIGVTSMSKKSVVSGEISLDDIELIIIEE